MGFNEAFPLQTQFMNKNNLPILTSRGLDYFDNRVKIVVNPKTRSVNTSRLSSPISRYHA